MQMSAGKSLWDLWNIPCYNIIVDHPMHYFQTLDQAPANGIVACADRYHMEYIRRFYPTVRRSIFLPTAGECLKSFEELKPFQERSIEVLFIGTNKYDDSFPYDDFSILLSETIINQPSKTFDQALEELLISRGYELTDDLLKKYMQQYRFVDANIIALFRLEILRTLVNAGIHVTVYGDQFETTDLYRHPNFIYKGRCTTEEGIRFMEDSKIVLNQLAWFKAGSSERIFEAMLQGAVALTDDSVYLKENFVDSVDIMFYSLTHLKALPDLVRAILSDSTLAETIRRNAYEKAQRQHMWIHRASAVLDDLSSHSFTS